MILAPAKLKPEEDATIGLSTEQRQHAPASAQVDVQFTASPTGQSYLSKQIAKYPYHIGRLIKNSSTPEPMAMLFLQCTSGGIFEHDHIGINISAKTKAIASVKHAAATVVHSMQQGQAITRLNLVAEESAYVEYTGNLNIMFPKSNLKSHIDVTLHPKAITLITDAYLIYDLGQKSTHFDQLETTINVYNHQHKLLARDHFSLSGIGLAEQLQAVGNHFNAHASIYVLSTNCTSTENALLLSLIRDSIINTQLSKQDAYIGSGSLPNECGVFVRLITCSGQPVQILIAEISKQLRKAYVENPKKSISQE